MSILTEIKRGIQRGPQRVIIYGPEGVGKTTLAASFPNPVFLDTEQGSGHIDVARLSCRDYKDLLEAVKALREEKHDFKTVVIDSIDWTERMATDYAVEEYNRENKKCFKNIEDFGYGKGYTYLAKKVNELLLSLNDLAARGMNVVLVGHSRRVKFEMPEAVGAYDKHEINLSKQVAPQVKEWSDAMLFCNFLVTVADGKGHGGSVRMVYTAPSAPWEAKNRHNMPAMLPMDGAEIGRYLFGNSEQVQTPQSTPQQSEPAPQAPTPEPAPQTQPESKLEQLCAVLEDEVGAVDFLVYKGELKPGQGLADLREEYQAVIIQHAARFNNAVRARKGGAV